MFAPQTTPVSPLPAALSRLLAASDPESRERAWTSFVEEYSRLIHLAARKATGDYDGLMDRYTYVLERLREDDFRRLRTFSADGRSKFTTWLVVVASRLCVDLHRRRYGRGREDGDGTSERRRRLVDLVSEDIDLDSLSDNGSRPPDERVRRSQLMDALNESLTTLDAEDRLFVRLRYEDGHTATETARILGLASEFAAYRRQRAILEALRSELLSRGVRGSKP